MAPAERRPTGAAHPCPAPQRPYAQFTAGFGIGTTAAYRYITEAVDLLAALAPTLEQTVREASAKAFTLVDGTLLPIDRIPADLTFYPGKHKRHGMNVQVLTDPFGGLLWASPTLPGAVHDIRAASEHGIIDALTQADIPCWADKEYRGAGGTVRIPYWGRWKTIPRVRRLRIGPTRRSGHS